jgi:hypothetical protein
LFRKEAVADVVETGIEIGIEPAEEAGLFFEGVLLKPEALVAASGARDVFLGLDAPEEREQPHAGGEDFTERAEPPGSLVADVFEANRADLADEISRLSRS